jgi:hypothetical protein
LIDLDVDLKNPRFNDFIAILDRILDIIDSCLHAKSLAAVSRGNIEPSVLTRRTFCIRTISIRDSIWIHSWADVFKLDAKTFGSRGGLRLKPSFGISALNAWTLANVYRFNDRGRVKLKWLGAEAPNDEACLGRGRSAYPESC